MARETERIVFSLDFERPILDLDAQIAKLRETETATGVDMSDVIKSMEEKVEKKIKRVFGNLSPWQKVELSRHPRRPIVQDYVKLIAKDFIPLHGDKLFREDRAIICGLATIGEERVMLIGTNKGRTNEEKQQCHFGYPHPEGYRKALAKMKLAEKYNLPIVCLVDTKGAFPGIGAEERGQSLAIAYNLKEMSSLRTPVIAVVVGEGGSGGALAIGVADVLAILEYAYFSVITPEGCAAILWKNAEKKAVAAEALKLTGEHLRKFNIVDEIIPEPVGGAHRDPEAMAEGLKNFIVAKLQELKKIPIDDLLENRYKKFRQIGCFVSGSESLSMVISENQKKKTE